MILHLDSERRFAATDMAALLDRHGVRSVLAALALALLRRLGRTRRVAADDLPARLRRDVGLTWDPPSPRHWDLRL